MTGINHLPHRPVAEAATPDGGCLTLLEGGGEYSIRLDGHGLMNSEDSVSEVLLGKLGGRPATQSQSPHFLMAGLGMGMTLRSLLDAVPAGARVTVVELIPEIVDWNRTYFGIGNGRAIDDPRVAIAVGDIWDILAETMDASCDAVLLDIDNGPHPLVQASNLRMYYWRGIQHVARVLKPGGRAVFWSAERDGDFHARLVKAGLVTSVAPTRQVAGTQVSPCFVYIADKPSVGGDGSEQAPATAQSRDSSR